MAGRGAGRGRGRGRGGRGGAVEAVLPKTRGYSDLPLPDYHTGVFPSVSEVAAAAAAAANSDGDSDNDGDRPSVGRGRGRGRGGTRGRPRGGRGGRGGGEFGTYHDFRSGRTRRYFRPEIPQRGTQEWYDMRARSATLYGKSAPEVGGVKTDVLCREIAEIVGPDDFWGCSVFTANDQRIEVILRTDSTAGLLSRIMELHAAIASKHPDWYYLDQHSPPPGFGGADIATIKVGGQLIADIAPGTFRGRQSPAAPPPSNPSAKHHFCVYVERFTPSRLVFEEWDPSFAAAETDSADDAKHTTDSKESGSAARNSDAVFDTSRWASRDASDPAVPAAAPADVVFDPLNWALSS